MMRWDPYHLFRDDEFEAFWTKRREREPRILLIVGRGFDPRALETARRLKAAGVAADVWLLSFDNGFPQSETRHNLTVSNAERLAELFDEIKTVDIKLGSRSGGSETSPNTHRAISAAGNVLDYDEIVVDISAMPRMVALTVIATLLHDLDRAQKAGGRSVNLHVTTAESVRADTGGSRGTLSDEVTLVKGFSGQLTAQASEHIPRVWFPVLGEKQHVRLSLIKDKLDPDEICPVIPFPSRDTRRGDEIIDQHRELIFDEFNVEPKNILLACEYNPFEAYKQIYAALERYRATLEELGGCKAYVSPLSSKLLSVGALLACYDHLHGEAPDGQRLMVGIPYVETADYADPSPEAATSFEFYSMWIRGEWEDLPAKAAVQ